MEGEEKREPIYQQKRCQQQPDEAQVMTVEIEGLPSDATSQNVKQMYFDNEHIVKATTEVNHITGACSGKAKVAIRC